MCMGKRSTNAQSLCLIKMVSNDSFTYKKNFILVYPSKNYIRFLAKLRENVFILLKTYIHVTTIKKTKLNISRQFLVINLL